MKPLSDLKYEKGQDQEWKYIVSNDVKNIRQTGQWRYKRNKNYTSHPSLVFIFSIPSEVSEQENP